MKFFGMILLSGYFLARERELFSGKPADAAGLLRDWALFCVCAGVAVFTGMLISAENFWFPAALLLSALFPVIVFKGRMVCALAGAACSFSVLNALPDAGRAALLLAAAEAGVFITAFFYQIARDRMRRLFTPVSLNAGLGALMLLFALAVFLGLAWQKAIQIS